MKIDFLVEAVRRAGETAKESFEKAKHRAWEEVRPKAIEKAYKELVIEEDLLCERIITSTIRDHDPEAVIYSEEMNTISELRHDDRPVKYLIDPLDGTHNFRYGLPLWGIGAAVLNRRNVPIAGVIYVPVMDLLLKCEGMGAPTLALSGSGWDSVSTCTKTIEQALVCYDNQFYKMGERAVEIYEVLTGRCFTTRITGSAVCDSALVACGKINARIWNNTECYDIAAGMRIVEGAGGHVCNFVGEEIDVFARDVVMCSNGDLKGQILEAIGYADMALRDRAHRGAGR